ncbi:hypothetical protein TRAPUB_9614 [Trametes pubescens]|uniref:Fungal-type protein kinase domain-containing protein n=1 Tax=Trametes pubescens TaxID=154538 RepID=A0A1M2W1W6_TRAPU|nr:hypothetical protein TRAPUB_9614 [Trametes pubescens]
MAGFPPEQPPIHTSNRRWVINDDSSFVVGGSPSTDWGGTSQGSPTPRPSQNSQITQASQASQASSVGHKLRKKGAGTGAWNTPIARTETSAQTFGFEDKTAKSRNMRLGEEMKGRMLGPMPVDKFLAQFLSADKVSFDDMPEPKGAFRDVLKQSDNITNETGIYAPLIRALNADETPGYKRGSRCPGFTFRNTSNHPDQSGGVIGGKKPDICCYKDDHLTAVETSDSKDPLGSRTNMGLAATFFEIKLLKKSDFFCDPVHNAKGANLDDWPFVYGWVTEAERPAIQEAFGQNVSYASEVAMRQFRHVVYSVTMAGTSARLIRWDRAGAIVTRAFDIHRKPECLCRIFWCFSHVSDAERGYDLTVEPASAEDENVFKTLILQHIQRQLPLATPEEQDEALEEHFASSCVTSVSVFRKSDDGLSYHWQYLVSRPIVAPLSPVGRATRTYWAVDSAAKKVVFLKDSWRQASDVPEGSVMKDLRSRKVPNIPPVEYEDDVPSLFVERDAEDDVIYIDDNGRQTTQTQQFLDAPWLCGSKKDFRAVVFRRTRYRLVLEFAGYPLTKFRGTTELLHGAYDAFMALHDAHGIAHRLHRDITPDNIILYHDGSRPEEPRKGYLVDWELSCDTSAESKKTRRRDASMYWQFASVNIIENLGASHTVQDDMESIYYVVLYCALLYLPHRLNGNKLLRLLGLIFDFIADQNGMRVSGGTGKPRISTEARTRARFPGAAGLSGNG